MKKLHVLGLTLFAVFAFCAVSAASAFAESEWLIDAKPVLALTATDIEGLLLLWNNGFGETEVDCEGILEGSVGPEGEDEVTMVTGTNGNGTANSLIPTTGETGYLTTGTGLDCHTENSTITCGASGALAEVWPDNLPWSTLIELEGTLFLDHLFGGGAGKEPGYDVLCNSTGTSNLCEGLATSLLENMATEGDVLGSFKLGQNGPLATCEIGEGDLEGEGLILVTETGHTLAVS